MGEIWVDVTVPWSADVRTFGWVPTTLVGDAASQVYASWGVACTRPTFQTEQAVVLDPTLTLQAAGVKSDDVLQVLDLGA